MARKTAAEDRKGMYVHMDPVLLETIRELADRRYTSVTGLVNWIIREACERQWPELLKTKEAQVSGTQERVREIDDTPDPNYPAGPGPAYTA